MASSTEGAFASPRAAVIRVLVGALADSSLVVREAAAEGLRLSAQQNAGIVLDCCIASLPIRKRRGGELGSHHAGVFKIMAYTAREMPESEIDLDLMQKLTKIAIADMTSSKDFNSDWQRAASALLVALASRVPDLVMDEVFSQLSGHSTFVVAAVQALADFAMTDALQFAPRVKGVLYHVMPILGGVRDNQRPIYANAFTCWCATLSQYEEVSSSTSILNNDMQALLYSALELFLGSWVVSSDPRVRVATVDAVGQMVGLISTPQLKSILPKLLPVILGVLKREPQNPLPIIRSLHMILDVVLLRDGSAPLIDFQGLASVISSILPMASVSTHQGQVEDWNLALKNMNEVLRCFSAIGEVFPEEIFKCLHSRMNSKEDPIRIGTFYVLRHLVSRLPVAWAPYRGILAEAIKPMLQGQGLNMRKAIVELAVAMAANCYFERENGKLVVEFLVRHSAIPDTEVEQFQIQRAAIEKVIGTESHQQSKNEFPFLSAIALTLYKLKIGEVSLSELRAVCDKSLLLLASTIPEMESALWPFLLKVLIPKHYTSAVAMVCKCIADIAKRRLARGESISVDYITCSDIPRPEEILARLLILLWNPMARDQLGVRILTVLYYLAPLFPKEVVLLWEDEIPKLKAFISDCDDVRGESWHQETWDSMIVNLLSESLDVIGNQEWTNALGDAFSDQYDLYTGDNHHTGLLHRCLGILLQKVADKAYVRNKIGVMYRQANVADRTNRLGLAMAMGLIAAAHLDTVLEKLKNILENHGRKRIHRLFLIFFDQRNRPEVDDVCAALALMYGYAAWYAPSTVIEARIDTLVGTNMLTGLLDVRTAPAKQAVIKAINLLGQAVIKAGSNGSSFPLKNRDQMLEYTIALMAGQEAAYGFGLSSSTDLDVLHTQELAVNACTTLVSVEPKLTSVMRDRILQATLGFLVLPEEPADVVDSILTNLINLLSAILLTSGEDGKGRAGQLQHLLRSLDQYVSSSIECHRLRSCTAVLALLRQFRGLCTVGTCPFNCTGICMHLRTPAEWAQSNNAATPLLPPREGLRLGERVMAYLPRCADCSTQIRKTAAQILDLFFSISLLLPKPVDAAPENRSTAYAALSALEELIAVTNWEVDGLADYIVQQIVVSVGVLLTTEELVAALRGCSSAICDKIVQAGKGTIIAVTQLIGKRGQELQESDIPRITQSLFSAAVALANREMQQQVLAAVCSLAEHAQAKPVFNELLSAAERDVSKQDGVWKKIAPPIQEAFLAIAQHEKLALPFIDYLVDVIHHTPLLKDGDLDQREQTEQLVLSRTLNVLPQAATLGLGIIFRGDGEVVKKALEQRYSPVLSTLLLRIGSAHGMVALGVRPLRDVIGTFQAFCDCLKDVEMHKVLAADGEQRLIGDRWTEAIGEIAKCSARAKSSEMDAICSSLWPALKRTYDFQRSAAAAALSEFVLHCGSTDMILGHLVGVLSSHIGDESPTVRRLCLKGLIQVPQEQMSTYAPQVVRVIVALIEDPEEEVALTAVQGLGTVLELVPEDAVAPLLLNLCVRLRSLQARQNPSMRAASFAALGAMSGIVTEPQLEAFLEQIHTILPRLLFHVNDEALIVRHACKSTLRRISPLLADEDFKTLTDSRSFDTHRKLDYDDFLRDFTRHLALKFGDRTDTYVTCALQAFDSPWPLIQANAAYFVGCLLSQLTNTRPLAVYLQQIISSLVRMTANAQSAVVRAKSATALSMLLPEIRSLTL